MKKSILLFSVLTFLSFRLCGQTRTIVGRVYTEDLETLPGVWIQISDTLRIGETDIEGRFKIKISHDTDKLIFRAVGMEATTLQIDNSCDTIEVLMMYHGTYDFISPKKIDRLRLRRFKKLPKLHLQLYEKGDFSTKTTCYSQIFESFKAYFDKIKKDKKNRHSN